ncbi:MAG: TIGR02285 family protein [Magnetovibrio sp.]|nr:TIGR02285 family protein [Magnetovibrio sp.]
MRRVAGALAGLFLGLLPWAGAQAETVTWFVTHFPPGYILKGPNAGTGHMDLVLRDFQTALKGFDHEIAEGPIARTLAEMKRHDGVCNNGLFKTAEREGYVAFSKPYIWIVANRLVVGEAAAAKIGVHRDPSGAINVETLLRDEAIRYGYSRKRSYAPVIDKTLAALGDNPRGQAVTHSETLLKMLAGGRFDVTFAYPAEATHHLRQLKLTPNFQYLPMAGVSRFFPVHVGCSKREVGKRVIAAVDKIIEEAGPYPDWYRHYEKNLAPETIRELRIFVPLAGQ